MNYTYGDVLIVKRIFKKQNVCKDLISVWNKLPDTVIFLNYYSFFIQVYYISEEGARIEPIDASIILGKENVNFNR